MIQQNFEELYQNNSDRKPMLVNPDGSIVQFVYPEAGYTVILIFSTLDMVSKNRLELYSRSLEHFQDENCNIFGVCRDSVLALQDWMRVTDINFPLVSDMNIAEDNIGIPQSLGASLVEGYPLPTAVFLDRNKYVRWTESTDFGDVGSVEETLWALKEMYKACWSSTVGKRWQIHYIHPNISGHCG